MNTAVVIIMASFNVLLGFWLLLPFISLSDKYAEMPWLEWSIGASVFFIGLVMLRFSIKEELKVLSIGALAGFIFWISTTGLAVWKNWQSPGWIFTVMIAAYHGFVTVNIRVNSKNLHNKNYSSRI